MNFSNIQERFSEAHKNIEKELENEQKKIRAKCKTQEEKENTQKKFAKKYDRIDDEIRRCVVSDIQREIGQRLREVREKYGLSLKMMTAQFNLGGFDIVDSSLSRWENGERAVNIMYLVWLAEKYSVNLHWLLTGEEKDETVQELQKMLARAAELSQKL